jgi:hypothetical protein
MLFCLGKCGKWFVFHGGEYDGWYLRGETLVPSSAGSAGESARQHTRKVRQEAAHRVAAMKALGVIPPSSLMRQALFGDFVRRLGEKGRERKKDYQFAKHYRNWCNDEAWRLKNAARGVTRNDKHLIVAPGGWAPQSWDEEHPDDPNAGAAFTAFGTDMPSATAPNQAVSGGQVVPRSTGTAGAASHPGAGSGSSSGPAAAAAPAEPESGVWGDILPDFYEDQDVVVEEAEVDEALLVVLREEGRVVAHQGPRLGQRLLHRVARPRPPARGLGAPRALRAPRPTRRPSGRHALLQLHHLGVQVVVIQNSCPSRGRHDNRHDTIIMGMI